MPLILQPLNFAIICDGKELETYDVKQDGPNSIRAYVASEAGKQFKITYSNNLFDFDLVLTLYIDGERTNKKYLRAGKQDQIIGILKTASVLPFKFQELELVDPDVENAPVVPEMGTIELQAFRCHANQIVDYLPNDEANRLHQGRVSERSKKAGWHHVSTADEVPASLPTTSVYVDMFDPPNAPIASVKIFYRPRELLMAEGVITGHGVGTRIGGGSEVNDRKRAREDPSPGPSTKRRGSTVKEEMSVNARTRRIKALKAELNSLTAGDSVKRERRSPSPIVVGQAAGEVIDLTLDD